MSRIRVSSESERRGLATARPLLMVRSLWAKRFIAFTGRDAGKRGEMMVIDGNADGWADETSVSMVVAEELIVREPADLGCVCMRSSGKR